MDHEGDAEDAQDDQHEVDAGQVALQQALLLLLPPLASLGVHLFAKCRLLKIVAWLFQVLEEHLVAELEQVDEESFKTAKNGKPVPLQSSQPSWQSPLAAPSSRIFKKNLTNHRNYSDSKYFG